MGPLGPEHYSSTDVILQQSQPLFHYRIPIPVACHCHGMEIEFNTIFFVNLVNSLKVIDSI